MEYYEELLNRAPPSAASDLDQGPPTEAPRPFGGLLTTDRAGIGHEDYSRLKNEKAAGICRISVELLKARGEAGIPWLTRIVREVWCSRVIPADWTRGCILTFKGKGSRMDCKTTVGSPSCRCRARSSLASSCPGQKHIYNC